MIIPDDRRVQNISSTGSSESHRVRTTLTVTVTRTEFSPAAAPSNTESNVPLEPSASLHITGRVSVENQFVKLGAFHTLDVEANRDVRIEKAEWDSIALDRINEASVPGRGAEVGAIVCGEGEHTSLQILLYLAQTQSGQAPLLSVSSQNT